MARSIVLVVGIMVCVSAHAADPISKPGETTLFDGKLKVQVKDDGTTTQFDVTYVSSSGSHGVGSEVASAKAEGWFIVAESANRIWIYKGGELLNVITITDTVSGGIKGTKSSVIELMPAQDNTIKALARAPKAVLDRLPASFKVPGKGK